VVLYIYMSECSPDDSRGLTTLMIAAGGNIILLLIAPLCLPSTFATDRDWYMLPAVCLTLSLIHLLIGWLALPESPKHLFIGKEHRRAESEHAVRFYHGDGADLGAVMGEFERERALVQYNESASLWEICRDPTLRWALFIVLIATFVPASSVINLKSQYLEPMLMQFGLNQSLAMVFTMLMTGVTVPLSLLAPWMVERFGRRPLFLLITALSTGELVFVTAAQALVDLNGGKGGGWFIPAVGLFGFSLGQSASMLGILTMGPVLLGEFCPHAARAGITQVSQVAPMPLTMTLVVAYPVVSAKYGALFLVPMLAGSRLLLYRMYNYLPETKGMPVSGWGGG